MRRTTHGALACIACLFPGGCGSGTTIGETGGTGSAEGVRYAPELVVLEQAEGDALLTSIGTDGHVLVFEGATERLRSLRPGETLMIRGLLAVTVLAVDVSGSRVAVLARPAALTEVITDGEIRFAQPLRFTAAGLAGADPSPGVGWPRLVTPAYAATDGGAAAPVWGKVTVDIDGWASAFTVSPADNRLNFSVSLTKTVHGTDVDITAEGYLENFDVQGDIVVTRGQTDELSMLARNLSGMIDLRWRVTQEVAQRALKNETIQLPGALSIPLAPLLGGLPLFLEVSAGVLIRPAFSTRNQISQGHVRVNYSGLQGFTARPGTIEPAGSITGEIELIQRLHVSPLAGMGMVVAFAAPRIDLSFGYGSAVPGLKDFKKPARLADEIAENLARKAFGEEAATMVKEHGISSGLKSVTETGTKAWFAMTSTAGVFKSGGAAMIPCERHWLILTGSVGVSAKFFGEKAERQLAEVFKRETRIVDPPTSFCESAG